MEFKVKTNGTVQVSALKIADRIERAINESERFKEALDKLHKMLLEENRPEYEIKWTSLALEKLRNIFSDSGYYFNYSSDREE